MTHNVDELLLILKVFITSLIIFSNLNNLCCYIDPMSLFGLINKQTQEIPVKSNRLKTSMPNSALESSSFCDGRDAFSHNPTQLTSNII